MPEGSRRATQCVCVRASFHLHVIHDVCLSVRWLFLVCLFVFVFLLFSLRRLPLVVHTLPVLCPALHLQCPHRRGLKPLRLRTMRSTAPWRFSILSQKQPAPHCGAHLSTHDNKGALHGDSPVNEIFQVGEIAPRLSDPQRGAQPFQHDRFGRHF